MNSRAPRIAKATIDEERKQGPLPGLIGNQTHFEDRALAQDQDYQAVNKLFKPKRGRPRKQD